MSSGIQIVQVNGGSGLSEADHTSIHNNTLGLKRLHVTDTDPTVNDDTTEGYEVGSRWVNTSDNGVFELTDATDGAAVWVELTGSIQKQSFTILSGSLANGASAQFNEAITADDVLIVGAAISTTAGAADSWGVQVYNDDTFAAVQAYIYGDEFNGISNVGATPVRGPKVSGGGSTFNVAVPYTDEDSTNEMHIAIKNTSFDVGNSSCQLTIYYVAF